MKRKRNDTRSKKEIFYLNHVCNNTSFLCDAYLFCLHSDEYGNNRFIWIYKEKDSLKRNVRRVLSCRVLFAPKCVPLLLFSRLFLISHVQFVPFFIYYNFLFETHLLWREADQVWSLCAVCVLYGVNVIIVCFPST